MRARAGRKVFLEISRKTVYNALEESKGRLFAADAMKHKPINAIVGALLSVTGLFTLFSLLFISFSGSGTLTASFLRQRIWQIFLLSALLTAANAVFFIPKISLYFKIATHFIALGAILMLTIWVSGYMERGNWVLLLIAFVMAYALIAPLAVFLYLRRERKKKTDRDYTPRYSQRK